MRSRIAVVAALGLVVAATPCPAQSLNGSGSSFVGPMMSKWTRDYKKAKEVEINYTTVGSGRGIAQITSQDVDFACTDAAMNEEQMQKANAAGGEVLHIPVVLGGVVPAYKLNRLGQFGGTAQRKSKPVQEVVVWEPIYLRVLRPRDVLAGSSGIERMTRRVRLESGELFAGLQSSLPANWFRST